MFKIGDFSKICRVPVSALRYYADIGLLEPAQIDRFTGYRYYSLDQLPRLNRILALKDLGLSLEQIAHLLDEAVSPAEIRGMLRLKRAEIQQNVEEEQARLARVEARLRQIEQEGKMPAQEVVLKEIEAQKVISIRETVTSTEGIGRLIGEAFQALARHQVEMAGPPLTLYYDEAFTAQNIDTEVAFPVAQPPKERVELGGGRQMAVRDLPGVSTAACAVHKGDYSQLGAVYEVIGRWIGDNGYRIVGPPREVYLQGGGDPAEAITEIQFPVEKT